MSARLHLNHPRFLAKAINSGVMKYALEPERGGGPVMREGREAPLWGEMKGMDRKEGDALRGAQREDLSSPHSTVF